MSCDLFIFAGEPSGDLHGEALIKALLEERPDLKICGVGGPRMRALPFTCVLPMEEFEVMGFVDVFLALPRILRHLFRLTREILAISPKIALFIDYPGFNLRLEKRLKNKGFKGQLAHYICPTVWAHGKKRIPLMENTLDLLLTIFPFEKSYFSKDLPVEYVGHPLVSRINQEPKTRFSWAEEAKVLSLFPGSRKKEILLNLPYQLEAARSALELCPHLLCALSVSRDSYRSLIERHIHEKGLKDSVILVESKDTYKLMRSSSLALATSGTVTLELALHGVATIVTYGIAPIDLFIAQKILRISLPYYCIVNILMDQEVFKELIGPTLTQESLERELHQLLSETYLREKQQLCAQVEKTLGTKKASRESARRVLAIY